MLKVSVLILAYNHEEFIAQALDSALAQIVDFDYEIVVGEDCSADNTRTILLEYQKQFPDKIRLLLNEKNLGMHKNFMQSFYACQGQYLAMLEGDDYWTTTDKLQKQVDFLDQHSECSICFHNALLVFEDGHRDPIKHCSDQLKEFSTIEDLFVHNFLPTASVVCRRELVEIPSWITKLGMVDWVLHILLARHGKLGFINEVMSIYRIHEQGVWSSLPKLEQVRQMIKMLETINIFLDYKYEQIIESSILNYYQQIVDIVRFPLQQELRELEQNARSEIEQLQFQLLETQLELGQYQEQVSQVQSELAKSQSLIAQTQTELGQSQSLVHRMQVVLAQSQIRDC